MPSAANAKPMSTQIGTDKTTHGDDVSPRSHIVARNATEYAAPRSIAHEISPTATSAVDNGVVSTASYSFECLILWNTFIVESKIAPFIADAAISAGATNASYATS